MSVQWNEFVGLRSLDEWMKIVSTYTLPEAKSILDKTTPPTINELLYLPWVDTQESGVYMHLSQPLVEDYHSHMYIGEASRNKGLIGRRKDHEKEMRKGPD